MKPSVAVTQISGKNKRERGGGGGKEIQGEVRCHLKI